jgi:hypothetical protein
MPGTGRTYGQYEIFEKLRRKTARFFLIFRCVSIRCFCPFQSGEVSRSRYWPYVRPVRKDPDPAIPDFGGNYRILFPDFCGGRSSEATRTRYWPYVRPVRNDRDLVIPGSGSNSWPVSAGFCLCWSCEATRTGYWPYVRPVRKDGRLATPASGSNLTRVKPVSRPCG